MSVDLVQTQSDISHQPTQAPPSEYLEPNSPEVIEMKSTVNFTRLPQDPPPTTFPYGGGGGGNMKPGIPMIIAPVSNGTSMTGNQVPGYSDNSYHPIQYGQDVQAMTTFGHAGTVPSHQGVSAPRPPRPRSQYRHTYEELPSQLEQVDEMTKHPAENGQGHYGSHMSHTEVDQAMLFPKSTSQVALTGTSDSDRKRPRKKLNPIYDGYQGPTDVVKTKGSSKPAQPHQQQHGSPVKQCSSCSVKCLKSPCTTFLVILVVFLMVIAGVLIFMGKITTPATGGNTDELSQPKPSTPNPSLPPSSNPGLQPEDLLQLIEQQRDVILQMQEKIEMLESVLGGSESNVNASLSTKVAQNSFTIEQLLVDRDSQAESIASLQTSVHDTEMQITGLYRDVTSLTAKAARLENSTNSLDTRITQLHAKAVTQSGDIRDIQSKNDDQDTRLFDVESQTNLIDQDYKFQLSALNRTIYGELDTISKMQGPRGYNGSEGPQGLSGAGNLTRCVYGSQRNANGFESTTTVTPWVGPGENKVFLGLTCSTDGGTTATLIEDESVPGRFQCECSGNIDYKDDRFGRACIFHYWSCPLIS